MTKSRGLRVPKGTRTQWVEDNRGKHICGCGCGGYIQVRPEQYPNVARYLHGHNTAITHRKPRPDAELCACGCGEFARPGNRYINAHAVRGRTHSVETRAKIGAAHRGERNPQYGKPAWNRKEPVPPQLCACSCGERAMPGRRFISGHNTRGTRMRRYRGFMQWHGYIKLDARDHPYADRDGYVLEHRLVLEESLRVEEPGSEYLHMLGHRLYLRPEIIVHHIDGSRDCNERSNLLALTREDHAQLHQEERRQSLRG